MRGQCTAGKRGHTDEGTAERSHVELVVGEAGDVQRFGANFTRRVGPGKMVPD